jgi:Domain of unknown function (DUF4397)
MMKKYIGILFIAICTIGLAWSCSKKLDLTATTQGVDGSAYIKIAQYSPGFRQVFNNRDSINIYVNGNKLNGTFLTYGSFFPSTTNLYAAVPPGAQSIRLTVNGVTTPDSVTLATFTKTLAAGSYYSFLINDSMLSTNEAKQIFVQDIFTRTDTLHYTVRFAHTILNDTTGKNVDVYSSRLGANMFSNISPGTVTSFATEPYTFVNDTLIIRRAGGLFELARFNAAVFARERAFTVVYKGQPIVTGATKPRSVSIYANQ